MPESKEKAQAKQGYENLKTFGAIADAFEEIINES